MEAAAELAVEAAAELAVEAAAGSRVVEAAGGASLVAQRSAVPDRLSGLQWEAEREGALRLFPAGLRVMSADREQDPAPDALQLFPPVLVWAIAPKSADSPASAIDRV